MMMMMMVVVAVLNNSAEYNFTLDETILLLLSLLVITFMQL
jgi:hypothetical protein